MLSRFVFPILSLAGLASAEVRQYDLNIANGRISPDGGPARGAVLANNMFPGPLITGNKDDIFELKVTNSLTDKSMDLPTAVHWHGFFQFGTAYDDGPSHTNQAPILPGDSYTYRFQSRDQAGTFWYHSHFHAQYVDGLRGVIIVRDPQDPHKSLYDFDLDEHVLSLSEWYSQPSKIDLQQLLATGSEPTPSAGLINGSGGKAPKYVANVAKGKRYRMRIVNSGAMTSWEFSIDKHDFTVIEVDSINHKPVLASKLVIYPGQRYSIVVNANQQVGNYAITIKSKEGPGPLQETTGIFRYAGASALSPRHTKREPAADLIRRGSAPELKDDMLHPLSAPAWASPKVQADLTIPLKFTKTKDANGQSVWTINDSAFAAPHNNILEAVFKGATTTNDFAKSDNVYILGKDQVVDLVISGSANGFNHPFHLHGHEFAVMTASSAPLLRDVQPIGGSSQTLRFKSNNPGVWFMHCHIDWHLEQGLAVVFVERPQEIRETVKPSADWFSKHSKWEAWRDANGEH
ncbi:laccase [Geranomyces variabilis]|nr:laccase [Geranomyces variabilis]